MEQSPIYHLKEQKFTNGIILEDITLTKNDNSLQMEW